MRTEPHDTSNPDRVLDTRFDQMREVDLSTSWPQARVWIESEEARLRQGKPQRRPSAASSWLSRALAAHSVRIAGAMLLVLALIGCVSPVGRQVTLGYTLTGRIAFPPDQARARLREIPGVEPHAVEVLGIVTAVVGGREEVQAYVGSGRATVNGREIITPTSQFVFTLPDADRAAIERYRAILASMGEVDSLRADPIRQKVTQRGYRVVLQSMSHRFDTDLPPEAVESAVRRHLDGMGMEAVNVRYITRADGPPAIELSIEGDPAPSARRVEGFLREVGAAQQ
ncbi:MAG TPA: hypothetical protein VF584_10430 [Longimicrobium sp.]|jgi:hypothetical protein